jgi:predicted pyridoxine 5'-phosphate oxidase superfamily flavin-nucleotide-binding protein
MADRYMHEVLTPAVLEAQQKYYGQRYSTDDEAPSSEALRDQEVEMIESRDSFYMATVTENDWPYVQHRGGPVGFLKVLGPKEIAFVDYRGNRQLISAGSLAKRDRVSLFLIDYPSRTRLKMLGHATVLDANEHPDLAKKLEPEGGHGAKPERIFRIETLSYDWNCPKFITPRFTAGQVQEAVTPLQDRIVELEAQLKSLKP